MGCLESRLMASHLLQSNGTRVSTKRYFSNNNYQHMEQYGGGIQDDHIPFLRKGITRSVVRFSLRSSYGQIYPNGGCHTFQEMWPCANGFKRAFWT
jgi:hypothetical protein